MICFYFNFHSNWPRDIANDLSQVDEALFRAADVFMITVNKLAERIAENVRYLIEDSNISTKGNDFELRFRTLDDLPNLSSGNCTH